MPFGAVLGLERAAENRAVSSLLAAPAASASTLMRSITIGTEAYMEWRMFSRDLMLQLHEHRFKDTGTRKMWNVLDGWWQASRQFDDWTHLLDTLHSGNFLTERRVGRVVPHLGPETLGKRPGWTSEAKNVQAEKGHDVRHVVSSSSLGKAIETVPADLRTLNEWLATHNQPVVDRKDTPVARREAKIRIWRAAHNHIGNLFSGRPAPNRAAGLIRAPLLGLRRELEAESADELPVQKVMDAVRKLQPPFRGFEDDWTRIVSVLAAEIEEAADHGVVLRRSVTELLGEYAANTDFDLPSETLRPGYYDDLERIHADIVSPKANLFAPGGGLDHFMKLNWRK